LSNREYVNRRAKKAKNRKNETKFLRNVDVRAVLKNISLKKSLKKTPVERKMRNKEAT
jgi:hypothetical protein